MVELEEGSGGLPCRASTCVFSEILQWVRVDMGRFATKNDLMFLKDHWLLSREMNTVSLLYMFLHQRIDSTNHKLENLRKF